MVESTVVRRQAPAWTVPLVAAAAAVVVHLIGVALGVEPEARVGAAVQAVSAPAVVIAALAAGFAGWGVRALLARVVRGGGERAWLVLCGVVLLGSMVGPAGGTTTAAVVLLVVLHVVVAAVVALGLRRAA